MGAGEVNGKGTNAVQTFIYAAYATPNTYTGFSPTTSPTRGLSASRALSHEVAEWLDDPFGDNAVRQTPLRRSTARWWRALGVMWMSSGTDK